MAASVIKPVLYDRLTNGEPAAFGLLLIIFFGVVVFYLFSLGKDFQGTTVAIKKMFPDWHDSLLIRVDFFIVSVLGSGVAALLFNPSTSFEAMAAGLGWVGTLNTLSATR